MSDPISETNRTRAIFENDMEAFAAFFRREGDYWYIGGSTTTYPDGDAEQRYKYYICAELERRGVVTRNVHDDGSVEFIVMDNNAGT